jgi:hypothetical protein
MSGMGNTWVQVCGAGVGDEQGPPARREGRRGLQLRGGLRVPGVCWGVGGRGRRGWAAGALPYVGHQQQLMVAVCLIIAV